jgi:hypothetical protein
MSSNEVSWHKKNHPMSQLIARHYLAKNSCNINVPSKKHHRYTPWAQFGAHFTRELLV